MTEVEQQLKFRTLVIPNRVIRATRTPGYEERGHDGCLVSFDWERRFATAGVGAIISARTEVRPAGGPLSAGPSLGFWQEHVRRLHDYGCAYVLRLGQGYSPHAIRCAEEIADVSRSFADAARWARETGADGIEIDAGRGSLIAQLMSPCFNDLQAEHQGSLRNRSRLAREIVRAVRRATGDDFHVQVRLRAAINQGQRAVGTLHLIGWLEDDGIDAIHLMADGDRPEVQAATARSVKYTSRVPVLRNGVFETPDEIVAALDDASCDAVTLTRPYLKHVLKHSTAPALYPRQAA